MFVNINIFIISLTVCLVISFTEAKKLPPYLTLCHANDPNINDCFRKAVEQLRPHFLKGIPELYIPPMNPLVIPQAGINSGTFNANFKDIQIYYANEFLIDKLNVDLPNNHIELGIRFPRLRVKSTYTVSGRLLLFQLEGHGPADGNFTDVTGVVNIEANRITRKGKQYIDIGNDRKIHLELGKPHFLFENLFKDNEQLNEQTNNAINENIVDIIEELRPVVEKVVADVVFGTTKTIFDRFSFDELFPK